MTTNLDFKAVAEGGGVKSISKYARTRDTLQGWAAGLLHERRPHHPHYSKVTLYVRVLNDDGWTHLGYWVADGTGLKWLGSEYGATFAQRLRTRAETQLDLASSIGTRQRESAKTRRTEVIARAHARLGGLLLDREGPSHMARAFSARSSADARTAPRSGNATTGLP